MFWRIFILIALLASAAVISAENKVTSNFTECSPDSEQELSLHVNFVTNEGDKASTINWKIECTNRPINIKKIEWLNCGNLLAPLQPLAISVRESEIAGRKGVFNIKTEFPFSTCFDDDDALFIHTDKGTYRVPTSSEGRMKENFSLICDEYEQELAASKSDSKKAWTILGIIVGAVLIIGGIIYIIIRQRFLQSRKEMEEMSMLIVDRNAKNLELEQKVEKLYGSRLDTLNMLCNEYFEKNDSETVRLSLYNEVEKQILALRDSKSVAELETIVNMYLDNILIKIKEQLPGLSIADIKFLTYLYAGFSPRAICIFTDIKIKNFYNRRSRLKERILESEAPLKEWFVSKM